MTARSDITPELLRQLLDYDPDTGILIWKPRPESYFASASAAKTWRKQTEGKQAGWASCGYLILTIKQLHWPAHRAAFAIMEGYHPDGEIDHINGDRMDNRWSNLRVVTMLENMRNREIPSHNKSGVMGVDEFRGKWRATIKDTRFDRQMHLGTFKTIEEATAARKAAERVLGYHPNHGRKPRPRRKA